MQGDQTSDAIVCDAHFSKHFMNMNFEITQEQNISFNLLMIIKLQLTECSKRQNWSKVVKGTQTIGEDYFSPAFGGTHSWIFLRVVE